MSLRHAAQLLYGENVDEQHAEACAELVNLGLLEDSRDLDGLDSRERETFVSEILEFYHDLCSEPHEELQARRVAGNTKWNPLIRYDRNSIKDEAYKVLAALKNGHITRRRMRRGAGVPAR